MNSKGTLGDGSIIARCDFDHEFVEIVFNCDFRRRRS